VCVERNRHISECIWFTWYKFVCVCVIDRASFLGISVVGQSNKAGDGGIYVGSIMKGSVVCSVVCLCGIHTHTHTYMHIAYIRTIHVRRTRKL